MRQRPVYAPALRPIALGAVLLALAGCAVSPPEVAELEKRLAERDAQVTALEARLARVEQAVAVPRPGEGPAPSAPRSAPGAAVDDETGGGGGGRLDVDPAAAQRALERTLVLTGDLLLPPGKADIEPSLSYAYSDTRRAQGLRIPAGVAVANVQSERDDVTAALGLRLGLPYGAQLEVGLPAQMVRQTSSVFSAAPPVNFSESSTGTGVGDLRIGLAKTLWREDGLLPDIIGRIAWDTNTGKDSADGVDLDAGFNEISASISALKRVDPLALTARVGYEHAFEEDGVQPGATVGVGVGVSLAASPSTSMSMGFDVSSSGEVEVDGRAIPGSESNQASLSIGVSSVVARNALVNVRVGAGLTDESTDYFVVISTPVRIGVF